MEKSAFICTRKGLSINGNKIVIVFFFNADSVMWVIPYLPIYLPRQYSFCFLITNKNLASCENENKCFALSFLIDYIFFCSFNPISSKTGKKSTNISLKIHQVSLHKRSIHCGTPTRSNPGQFFRSCKAKKLF